LAIKKSLKSHIICGIHKLIIILNHIIHKEKENQNNIIQILNNLFKWQQMVVINKELEEINLKIFNIFILLL
jgi:hypothetical protein